MGTTAVGRLGERLARVYLERKGFSFSEANFKRVHGEIDLIMRDGDVLVFAEVKTRRSLRYGTPLEAVTESKRRHIRHCADIYMAERGVTDTFVRFDVVEVWLRADGTAKMRHIPNAF